MPELPEVITIRNDLKNTILNKKIVNIKTYNNYALEPSKEVFKNFALGHTIKEVGNIAKLLTMRLSSDYYIATHLNMSGNLLYNHQDKYVKIKLTFEDNTHLNYSSIRMFGYFEVWHPKKVEEYKLKYGKTAIESDLTHHEFIDLIKNKDQPIKNILLNQKLVSGIGNIYANDALYLSKIHPKRKANTLSDEQLTELFKNVVLLLEEGIEHRGSTIDRYKDIFGKPGTHQHYFRVYGKTGKLCEQCGENAILCEKIQGRGTFFCGTCQEISAQKKLL